MYRVSVFAYVNYDRSPYYTYFRATIWLDDTEGYDLGELWEAVYDAAEYAGFEKHEVREKGKVEVEQVDEDESPPDYDGSIYVSDTAGAVPAEDYLGRRRSEYFGSRDDADEADELGGRDN